VARAPRAGRKNLDRHDERLAFRRAGAVYPDYLSISTREISTCPKVPVNLDVGEGTTGPTSIRALAPAAKPYHRPMRTIARRVDLKVADVLHRGRRPFTRVWALLLGGPNDGVAGVNDQTAGEERVRPRIAGLGPSS